MEDIDLVSCTKHNYHNVIHNNNYGEISTYIGEDEDLSGDLVQRDKIWMFSKQQKKDLVKGYVKEIDSENEKFSIIFLLSIVIKFVDEAKCYKMKESELYAKRFKLNLYHNNVVKGLRGFVYILYDILFFK